MKIPKLHRDPVDVIDLEEDSDGLEDPSFPVSIREQRIVRARRVLEFKQQRDRADQVDHVVAEDHGTTDVNEVLQLLQSQDDIVFRKAPLCNRTVTIIIESRWCAATGCNLVPQVAQVCQARSRKKRSLTYCFIILRSNLV